MTHPNKEPLEQCRATIMDALETCVDKIGIGLLKINTQLDLWLVKDSKAEQLCKEKLETIERTQTFVQSVDDAKVIYDMNKKKFLPLSDLYPNGLEIEGFKGKVPVQSASKENCQLSMVNYNSLHGTSYVSYPITDPVEDVLLIFNNLKKNGRPIFEPIEMRFGAFATLKEKLNASIQFLND